MTVCVDDILAVGLLKSLWQIVKHVECKYKVSLSWLVRDGDEISFLKRTCRLLENDLLVIIPRVKHVERLIDLLRLSNTKPKATPLPSGRIPQDDEELSVERENLQTMCGNPALHRE